MRTRVRMYQVGFGDCALLTLEYARAFDGRRERHILIDFGSSSPVTGVSTEQVAELIREHTGGKLDAIVLSHRHKDHMSAFGATASREIIADLAPDLVVRPWTEDPQAAHDATSPRARLIHSLDSAQAVAESVARQLAGARGAAGQLRELALEQVKNKAAVDQLDAWAASARGEYLSVGSRSLLEEVIPGIAVDVLGPPTVDDDSDVLGRPRERDPEYWMLLDRALASAPLGTAEPADGSDAEPFVHEPAALDVAPGTVRWIVEKMQRQRLFVVQRIVRSLDNALNNTSLILLFRIGAHTLLFPGDAQIENWQYVLQRYPQREELLERLAEVDLYKVGHHGSRNATPREGLYERWRARRTPVTSLLSTKLHVHGETAATRVPRATLLRALAELGEVHSTHRLPGGQSYIEVSAPTSERHFVRASAAPR